MWLLLSSPFKLSSIIVVFNFNESLNDVVPVSPMLLPVDLMKMGMSGLLIKPFMMSLVSRLRSS